MDRKYWPFESLPKASFIPRLAVQVTFMEAAFAEGYQPYIERLSWIAGNPNGRQIDIAARSTPSRDVWELFLSDPQGLRLSAYISGFNHTANAALAWLRGANLELVVDQCRPYLIERSRGRPTHTVHAVSAAYSPGM